MFMAMVSECLNEFCMGPVGYFIHCIAVFSTVVKMLKSYKIADMGLAV
jgi:hypothetical protein